MVYIHNVLVINFSFFSALQMSHDLALEKLAEVWAMLFIENMLRLCNNFHDIKKNSSDKHGQ